MTEDRIQRDILIDAPREAGVGPDHPGEAPRGSGADRPQGALRAIDSSVRLRRGPAFAGAAFGGISCLSWQPPRVSDGRPSWMM